MNGVLRHEEFNDHDLDNGKTPLREKFNEIIKDLEENKYTNLGDTKLIKGDGDIKYFRAKLSDSDRLLFTSVKHNDKDVFVVLEVILNHDYHKSKFLTNREKIKNIEIIDKNNEEVSDNASTLEIDDAPQVRWLGKFITFSAKQEDIVERVGKLELPLVINGAAGSGKTSVALESLKSIKKKFEGGKILYITKSKNLIKELKKLLEYEYYDRTADEFKIAAYEEIDFLSLHEFLEKQAEDIKGKKPINRSKFSSWFNEICKKGKFKEYKKDGDKIFEEFTAVIGGKGLLGEDGKDRYAKLGDRQSMFSVDERNRVYDFFKEYREFIDKDSEYYDPNLVAHECIVEGMYDAVVVDEVQDLTESTLSLTLQSLKDENKSNFLLCGDVNQVIHPSFFSLSKLKSFLCQNKYIRDQGSEVFYTFEKNYRNSERVIEFANRILHLKNYCFASEDKITVDNAFFMKSDTKNKGNVDFIAKDQEQEIARKVSGSIDWAILVLDDESKESTHQLFDTPLVFNIHEAKGLEFKNVILYKFTSCKAYNEIWNIACSNKSEGEIDNTINRIRDSYNEREVKTSRNKDKKDKSLEVYKFYMNALYVGVTRAVSNVYIIDDESNLLKVIKPEKESHEDIKKEESSSEAWRDMALELIEKGNIEQAERIARKLQSEDKKEYAEEVTNALKAKGHGKEARDSDKGNHTNSVLESNMSSKSSQSSEHEKDDISKPQNEKGKHNQNKKKKAKKSHQVQEVKPHLSLEDSTSKSKKTQNGKDLNDEKESKRLEKNTKEFFSALKIGNLQKAKRLIKQGVNVNAKNKEDDTPLYLAVKNGYDDVVKLLLENGAKVDARYNLNCTFLHMAAEKGHANIVELLLKHGADVNAKNDDSITSIHVAVRNNYYEVVKLLLENGAKVDARDTLNSTPLHLAAENGCFNTVKLLLQHKAEVNTINDASYTPLHQIAKDGHADIVKLLLDYGADVNAKSNEGSNTPLSLALENGHPKVADLLLADPNINVGCIKVASIDKKNKEAREKFLEKFQQDYKLFNVVKQAAEIDENKVDELLKEIEELLKSKSKYGFKPSLNYSPDGNNENTTIEIAIKADGKLLHLLYDYAEKDVGADTEIFERLKKAKENSQSKVDLCDVSVLKHPTPNRRSTKSLY